MKEIYSKIKNKIISTYKDIKRKIKKLLQIIKINTSLTNMKINKKLVLIISHSNYMISVGGTEKYIYEQANNIKDIETSLLQIFPCTRNELLNNRKSLYGLNLNGKFVGYYSINKITKMLLKHTNKLQKIYIHHIMYWQYKDFTDVFFKISKYSRENILYVHDFFQFTPTIYKIYTAQLDVAFNVDEEYNLIDYTSNNDEIIKWQQLFKNVYKSIDKIIVPSDFMKNAFYKSFPQFSHKVQVIGHLKLINEREKKSNSNANIRIAYLGYKLNVKGWDVWEKIYKNRTYRDKYFLYHIGSNEEYSPYVKCFKYSFVDGGIMAATNLLKENKIDCVILWSTIPESYSYTLYESLAAGCFVITSRKSGNISDTINKLGKNFGVSLNSETELYRLLEEPNLLEELLKNKRLEYDLLLNVVESRNKK